MSKFSLRFLNPKNFKNLSKKQKALFLLVLAALIAGVAFALGLFTKQQEIKQEEAKQKYHSQLTGLEVEKEESERPILGIMIENHPDARPQTGLDAAGIVFETVAEGGITRYLVLYQENQPKEVGSVRSVRTYYLDWAMGLDASLAHVGGAADALSLIDQRNAKSLSQFKYPDPYRRVDNREAPHDMFASMEELRSLQKDLNHKKAEFVPFPRSDDAPVQEQEPGAPKVNISFSNPTYAVEFRYDKETNAYTRYLAGSPDIDAAINKPITVKNVVVIQMPTTTIKATGRGEAVLFKDGKAQKIRWVVSSYRERIQFNDLDGNEVSLNRGDLWISALPSTGDLKY
jgi:hypothetical protein